VNQAAEFETLVSACERDLDRVAPARTRGGELATAIGGELAFRWQVVDLRAALRAPPDDDSIRERYGELVDRHRDDPDRMARLREIGDEIRRLEAEGVLPSALVVRAPRKPQPR
jgi:hypothetical protein